MSRIRTTFVIGAGASKPAGLPTATELFEQARQLTIEDPRCITIKHAMGVDLVALQDLLVPLQRAPRDSSIDQWILRCPDETGKKLGKVVAATLLGETLARPIHWSEDDWILSLVHWLARPSSITTLAELVEFNEDVTFVTFNFDNLLEERLAEVLQAMFPREDAQAAVGRMRIIHAHGSFPPGSKMVPILSHPRFEGMEVLDPKWVKAAADVITLATDDTVAVDRLHQIQKAVGAAFDLFFLGFSYAEPNMRRLGVPKCLTLPKRIVGTALNLSGGGMLGAKQFFTDWEDRLQLPNCNCSALFHDFIY